MNNNLSIQYINNCLQQNMSMTTISKMLSMPRYKIYSFIKKSGIKSVKQYRINNKFNQNFFEIIDDEFKAYWLGFIFADGCIYIKDCVHRVQIILNEIDIIHLKKWHESINSNQNIIRCQDFITSSHHSSKMCNDLINLGCVPRKSLILKFPMSISPELIRHFIRGYFDGDGTLYIHKNKGQKPGFRVSFIGTKDFLFELEKNLFVNLNIKRKNIVQNKSTGNNFGLNIGGYKESDVVLHWLYDDSKIYLDRKYNKFKKGIENGIL